MKKFSFINNQIIILIDCIILNDHTIQKMQTKQHILLHSKCFNIHQLILHKKTGNSLALDFDSKSNHHPKTWQLIMGFSEILDGF